MSIYAQAVMSGINALAGTEADRVYASTYNQVRATEAKKANIRSAMQAAQYNIAAVKQDKVLSNIEVQINQDNAEAAAKVAAATAGVEGGSVDDVMYETEKNEAFAINRANRQADIATEGYLAQITGNMSSLLSINEDLPKISYVDDLLGAFSSFEVNDAAIGEAFSSGNWELGKIFGTGG